MGLIPMEDRKPGLRVRHRQRFWTGTITQVMLDGHLMEVAPDGLDRPGRPQWFEDSELEPADSVPARADLSPKDRLARRYLTDGLFHHMVHRLLEGLLSGDFTVADIQDATLVAEDLQRQRERRAAGDNVRGKGQTDAQKERGNDGPAEPKPGGPGPGPVSR